MGFFIDGAEREPVEKAMEDKLLIEMRSGGEAMVIAHGSMGLYKAVLKVDYYNGKDDYRDWEPV